MDTMMVLGLVIVVVCLWMSNRTELEFFRERPDNWSSADSFEYFGFIVDRNLLVEVGN